MTVGELEKICKLATKRKGLLIYFGSNIFQESEQYLGGIESGKELLFVTPKPLTLDTISGVEFRSPEDEKAFFRLF